MPDFPHILDARPASGGPTIFVAASDALASSIAMAAPEYRCDGTADDVQIQAAIDALPASGGKVMLSEGTFNLSTRIDLGTLVNTELCGQGWGTVLKPAAGANISVIRGGLVVGTYLHDFSIDGNRDNNTSGMGIQLQTGTAHDIRIERLYIHDTDGQAINCTANKVTVAHCYIDNCDGGLLFNVGAGGCHVLHNEISNIGVVGSIITDGISNQGNNNVFVFNKIHDTSDTGINLAGSHHIAIGNECYLNGNSGINTGSGDHLTIKDNICYANGRKADAPRSNTGIRIRDNTAGDATSQYIICEGNRCYEDVTAHSLPGGALGQLSGIEIRDVDGGGSPDNLIIQGNELTVINAAPGGWTAILRTDVGSTTAIRNNLGHVTDNSGIITLPTAGGVTSIVVPHGLDVTPSVGDVMVTPVEAWGSITQFWISAYDDTNFTITVDIAPGQDVDFAWKAVVL